MPGLNHTARISRRTGPIVVEILSQCLRRAIVEMIGEQCHHLVGERKEPRITTCFEINQSCLQEMHMGVLLAVTGRGNFGQVTAPVGVAHARVEEVEGAECPIEHLRVLSQTVVPSKSKQDERVIVEIGGRIHDTPLAIH